MSRRASRGAAISLLSPYLKLSDQRGAITNIRCWKSDNLLLATAMPLLVITDGECLGGSEQAEDVNELEAHRE